jgi:hypothetical protein
VKRKRYSRKFQRMAVERLRTCDDVNQLAQELHTLGSIGGTGIDEVPQPHNSPQLGLLTSSLTISMIIVC